MLNWDPDEITGARGMRARVVVDMEPILKQFRPQTQELEKIGISTQDLVSYAFHTGLARASVREIVAKGNTYLGEYVDAMSKATLYQHLSKDIVEHTPDVLLNRSELDRLIHVAMDVVIEATQSSLSYLQSIVGHIPASVLFERYLDNKAAVFSYSIPQSS